MTGNTSATVRTAMPAAVTADGNAGDRGQASAKDAAAAFQSVLKGMKDTDAPAEEGARRESREEGAQPGPDQGGAKAGDGADLGASKTGNSATAGSGSDHVAFSTSNLVDSLRDVSHTVLSRFMDVGGQGESPAWTLADGQARAGSLPARAAALSSRAVFAALPGQVPGQASGGVPGQASGLSPGSGPQTGPEQAASARAGGEGTERVGTSSLFAQFGVEPEAGPALASVGARGSLLPEEAGGTVRILGQETHFAPNMRLSPAQQVGDQLATAMKSLAADSAPAQAGLTHKAEGPVVKTLDIQLTPHELGTVKVSLRMVGDSVEVTLQTSNPQTADLLKQDRQLLDQMLRTTGFKADTITIQAADDRGTVQSGSSTNGNSGMGQNGTGSGAAGDGQPNNGNAGQRQPQGHPRDETLPHSEAVKGTGHEDDTGISLSDGIYL
jgi:flagellar hook-length control protein FliK